MRRRGWIVLASILGALVVLGGVAAFVMFGPPHVAERLARPSFCASCHIMKPQYEAFQGSVHSGLGSCNDCHLPNTGFVRHWTADAYVGTRDLLEFNLDFGIPPYLKAKPMSKRWIEENCRRCHRTAVSHMQTQGKYCWECHREMYHHLDNGRLTSGQPTGGRSRE